MSTTDILKVIEAEKQAAIQRWSSEITPIGREMIDGAMEWIYQNLSVDGSGNLISAPQLTQLMNDFVLHIVDVAANSEAYQNSLTNFLESITNIKANMVKLNLITLGEDISKIISISAVQKTVVNEIIDQYTENGLNAEFAQPLRDLIFRNALGGMSLKEAKAQIVEYIAGGKDKSGKLHRYVTQTAQQAVDSYTGATNMKLKAHFKTTGFIISGSLIETSSKQCVYAVDTSDKGYLDNAAWEKVLTMARNNKQAPLIDGTDLENLSYNKLHHGCRHDFSPIIKIKKDAA